MMDMKKTIAIFAIEKTLEGMGGPILEQVCNKLYSKYYCLLRDCYQNPEYLKNVLADMFGDSHKAILESIEKDLEDFASHESIGEFLTKLVRT